MRQLKLLPCDDVNRALRVEADPDSGRYHVSAFGVNLCSLKFHEGELRPSGPNGLTLESLLAVVIDRLEQHQAGPLACPENEAATGHLKEARNWLLARSLDRVSRGVFGKQEK